MLGSKKFAWHLVLLALLSLTAASASADGVFEFFGAPFDDGTTTWAGSTDFDASLNLFPNSNLVGHVDWAVYESAGFPFTEVPIGTFDPASGDYIYIYQVFGTGSDNIHQFKVVMDNDANAIGAFQSDGFTGAMPTDQELVSEVYAAWDFAGFNSSSSCVLAFSSDKKPWDYFGSVINGGSAATVDPVPSPSDQPIPEPATLTSLIIALGIISAATARRRIRR